MLVNPVSQFTLGVLLGTKTILTASTEPPGLLITEHWQGQHKWEKELSPDWSVSTQCPPYDPKCSSNQVAVSQPLCC